jgi:UDP:flavonoid glycosyltransferase YjiC (YdhE family)
VDAGVMIGAGPAAEIRAALAKVLYDQELRSKIRASAVAPGEDDGRAASRSAEAILALADRGRET